MPRRAAIESANHELDPERLPRHVAVIMDGNGRWAAARGLPRLMGHERGYRAAKRTIRAAGELGIAYLTLYTFSSENWRRPQHETAGIMDLIRRAAKRELPDLQRNQVRVILSGRIDDLPAPTRDQLLHNVEATRNNTGLVVNLAVNYGGRLEIVDAVRKLISESGHGQVAAEDVTEDAISANLYAPEAPDPDLLIRTAGEMRISNFLLWQIAYTEIHVTPTLWPDFGRADLIAAIRDYQHRKRKFGGIAQET